MTKGHKGHKRESDRSHGDGHPFKEHRARGGSVGGEPKIDGVPEIGGHPEKPETKKPESGRKRGGSVPGHKEHHHEEALPKRKRGGKVKGKHPGHRLDRRARGGRMTPTSPFSGADGPDLEYAKANIPSGSEGKGRDKVK